VRSGFSLLEVAVALLVLEVCLLGVFGILVLANRSLTRAERLESATATLEGVADSLASAVRLESGRRAVSVTDTVVWEVGAGKIFQAVYRAGERPLVGVVGANRYEASGGAGGQ
jgi:Tfp pilus assembly protein PilV